MRTEFHGLNNYVIEPMLSEHATPRLEGLSHFSERVRDVHVAVEKQRGRFTVEITCDVNGLVLRSETGGNDLLSAFDEAYEKIAGQLNRHKGKLVRRRKQGPHRGEEFAPVAIAEEAEPEFEFEGEESEPDEFEIIRTKTHALKPMSPQEAVLQMEMVGHDFYVFLRDEYGHVGVVYKRKNGGYGLIEPETGGDEEE